MVSKDLKDGRKIFFGGFGPELLSLIRLGDAVEGDLIDVIGGTVQVVVNAHIPSGRLDDYQVQTATKNDRQELELINYHVVNQQIVDISKRRGEISNPEDKNCERAYCKAMAAA